MVFLEDSHSISSVINDFSKNPEGVSFVSLTPQASYAFERQKIGFHTIRDYYRDDAECGSQGLENYRRIDRIISVLEKEFFRFHTIPTLKPVGYSIYNLRFLLDGLWTTILVLKKIIEIENPEIIYLYTSSQMKSDIGKYAFSNDESVYAEVLLMDGWHIPIKIIQTTLPDWEEIQRTKANAGTGSDVSLWPKNNDLLFNLGLIGKREGFLPALQSIFHALNPWNHHPVLIYNNGYNWDDSLVELYHHGMYPIYRVTYNSLAKDPGPHPKTQDEIWKICSEHPLMREFDYILGIRVSDFFFDRLSKILMASVLNSAESYDIIKRMIGQQRICALLLTTRELAMDHAVVQAAHDAGIPVISWQHGGGGYADFLMMPYIEFINSDWHFVFGGKVAEKFTHSANICGFDEIPVFFPVGSSSLDHLWRTKKRARENQKHKKIVYITPDYHRNLYMISYPFNPLFLDEYLWDIQRRILELARHHPDREFVIKLHPLHTDKEPLKSYAEDHHISNVTLITSEKLVPELLESADFVIIDHIATGILQVLTLNVPVFAYTGLYPLDLGAKLMLKKCAYVSDNLDDLFEQADRYILTKTMPDPLISPDHCEFLKNYGTDTHAFNSAEKAALKLKEIIGRGGIR